MAAKPQKARPVASRPTSYGTSGTTAASYGSPKGARAVLLVGLVISGVFLVWLAWAAWFHSTPSVRAVLTGYEFTGEHLAVAHVDVSLDPGVVADCVVQAVAVDHSIVGEVHFSPIDGANSIQIRTERAATSITLIGCTAPGQEHPQ